MSILGKKQFTWELWECCNRLGYRIRNSIADGSNYCLMLNNKVRSNTAKPWSSYDITYDPKPQWLLSQECRYWSITSDYHCTKRLFLTVWRSIMHATLFHTRPPQNQYSRPPHLNKSPITSSQSPHSPWVLFTSQYTRDLSVKHTKAVKAPTYTHALLDIGNKECVKTVIEHEAHSSYGCFN